MMSASQGYQYQQPMSSVTGQPGQAPAANFQYANYAAQPQFAAYDQQQAQAYYGQAYDYNQAAAVAAAAAAGGAQAAVQSAGQPGAQQAANVQQVPYSQSASATQATYGSYDQNATMSYGQQPMGVPQAVPPPQTGTGGHGAGSQLSATQMPQFQSQMAAYSAGGVAQQGTPAATGPAGMQAMTAAPNAAAGQPAAGLEFSPYNAQAMGLMQAGHQWTQPPPQMQGAAAMMGGVPQQPVAVLAPGAAPFVQQAAAANMLQQRGQLPAAAAAAAAAAGLSAASGGGMRGQSSGRGGMRGRGGYNYHGDQRGGQRQHTNNYSGGRQLNDLGGLDPEAERPDTVLIDNLTAEQSTHENLLNTFQTAGQVKVNDKSGMPMIWIFKQQGIPTGRALVSYIEHSSAQNAISMFNGQNGWIVRLGKNSERPVIVQSNNSQQNSMSRGGGRGGFMNGSGGGGGGGKMRGGRGGVSSGTSSYSMQRSGSGAGPGHRGGLAGNPGSLTAALTGSGGGAGSGANTDPDWMCPGCRNKNYSWRDTCNRCNKSKPDNPELVPHPSTTGGRGGASSASAATGGRGASTAGAAARGGMGAAGNRFAPY